VAVDLQRRDLEIMSVLWRFHFLTTSQVAAIWWSGRDVSRARARLTHLVEARLLARFRPPVRHGTHQWIYRLPTSGLDELRRHGVDLTAAAGSSEGRVQMSHVGRFLRINAWLIAYAGMIGHRLADWRGPREARPLASGGSVGGESAPARVAPDAAAVIAVGPGAPPIALLVELTRDERPVRLAERLRRHAAVIASRTSLASGEPVSGTILVAPTLVAVEQLVRIADRELTSDIAIEGGTSPRERMMFCAQSDASRGSGRAWMLPALPPEHRESPEFTALEVSLPG
jgi:hypothetical protein